MRAFETELRGQPLEEDPGVEREEEHLEDRVERDETRGVLRIALGEIVPDEHHRDAARQPDQDHARHVLRPVAQEDQRESEHEHRPDDPVLHEREQQHPAVAEDPAELLVAHLRQRRIHHQDQPDRDRDRGRADAEPIESGCRSRPEPAEQEPQRHRQEDPHGQQAVEDRQSPSRCARHACSAQQQLDAGFAAASPLRPWTSRLVM